MPCCNTLHIILSKMARQPYRKGMESTDASKILNKTWCLEFVILETKWQTGPSISHLAQRDRFLRLNKYQM